MPRSNYKAPLIKSLGEAGYRTKEHGSARTTFTHVRRNGQRRVKLWFAGDVWHSELECQLAFEAALRRNYGAAYLGGYFIQGAYAYGPTARSFCVVLDNSKM